jgi:hypothetical protein
VPVRPAMNDLLFSPDDVIADLRRSLRSHNTTIQQAPRLLRVILETGAWRDFHTALGEPVHHDRFHQFVETDPDDGLGVDMALIDRIVGTKDPDLLRMLRAAKAGKRGRPRRSPSPGNSVDSTPFSGKGHSSDLTADRLAREAPEQYAAVKSGELSINAAAVAAGIRSHRISVRTDDPASVARSLRKHLSPGQLAELRRLLE